MIIRRLIYILDKRERRLGEQTQVEQIRESIRGRRKGTRKATHWMSSFYDRIENLQNRTGGYASKNGISTLY